MMADPFEVAREDTAQSIKDTAVQTDGKIGNYGDTSAEETLFGVSKQTQEQIQGISVDIANSNAVQAFDVNKVKREVVTFELEGGSGSITRKFVFSEGKKKILRVMASTAGTVRPFSKTSNGFIVEVDGTEYFFRTSSISFNGVLTLSFDSFFEGSLPNLRQTLIGNDNSNFANNSIKNQILTADVNSSFSITVPLDDRSEPSTVGLAIYYTD